MEDSAIIELYFQRSDRAVTETQGKYGRMLRSISFNIVKSMSDAEECENDTYMKTWNSIPPKRPDVFSAFLAKIVRNLSLDRYDELHAAKRGGGEIPALLDELAECLPDEAEPFAGVENRELAAEINAFLEKLKPDARNIFLRRYWFGDSVQEIAEQTGFGTSKIKMSLLRSRNELKAILEKEGYAV